MRFSWLRMVLRMRRFSGVTSSSSSSAQKLQTLLQTQTAGGTSRRASSEPAARILVICFFLQTFTAMSSPRGFSPTIMPSYTIVPGPMNSGPRSCALNRP